MNKKISPETEKLISCYQIIINNANNNKVPCYIASVPNGLPPKEFVTGLLGLDDDVVGHSEIKTAIGKADFNNYMYVLQDIDSTQTKLALFEPIFSFPTGGSNNVRTLRVVFEKPMPDDTNSPTFFDIEDS